MPLSAKYTTPKDDTLVRYIWVFFLSKDINFIIQQNFNTYKIPKHFIYHFLFFPHFMTFLNDFCSSFLFCSNSICSPRDKHRNFYYSGNSLGNKKTYKVKEQFLILWLIFSINILCLYCEPLNFLTNRWNKQYVSYS